MYSFSHSHASMCSLVCLQTVSSRRAVWSLPWQIITRHWTCVIMTPRFSHVLLSYTMNMVWQNTRTKTTRYVQGLDRHLLNLVYHQLTQSCDAASSICFCFQEAESQFTLAIEHNPMVGQYYVSRAKSRQMMEVGLQLDTTHLWKQIASLHRRHTLFQLTGKEAKDMQFQKKDIRSLIYVDDNHFFPGRIDTFLWTVLQASRRDIICLEKGFPGGWCIRIWRLDRDQPLFSSCIIPRCVGGQLHVGTANYSQICCALVRDQSLCPDVLGAIVRDCSLFTGGAGISFGSMCSCFWNPPPP